MDYIIGHKDGMLKRSPALRGAFKKIKTFLKQRADKFRLVAVTLKELYEEYPNNEGQNERWRDIVHAMYYLLKKQESIDVVNADADTKPDLGELMAEFQAAKDVNEAYNIFKQQCASCHWSTLPDSFSYEFKTKIYEITRRISSEVKKNVINLHGETEKDEKLTHDEFTFASGLFDEGTYFFSNLKRYEQCAEVLYFGIPLLIDNLKQRLNKEWPHLSFTGRVNQFCLRFSLLYQRISNTDIHANSEITDPKCMPDSTHYYRYIKNLGADEATREDYYFIAQILGAISYSSSIHPSACTDISKLLERDLN